MLDIYCIPGIGVDERLFKNLLLKKCSIHYIKWESLFKNETLPHYAMRLSEQIDQSKPFALIGVSFGGMCCAEIAKKLNPVKTFLISSCINSDELPGTIKLERYLPIQKIVNDELSIRIALLMVKRFGIVKKEDVILFKKMLRRAPIDYFNRALNCIINWKQHAKGLNVIHIHGTADRILPFKNIKSCDYQIKEGTHLMVMDRAEEISKIINEELEKIAVN